MIPVHGLLEPLIRADFTEKWHASFGLLSWGWVELAVFSLGAAWIFTRSGGAWSQQGSKLIGADWLVYQDLADLVAACQHGINRIALRDREISDPDCCRRGRRVVPRRVVVG